MRPEKKPGELFAAFSRITARAFGNDRLLSCPALSKAPNYGDVLRRFLTAAPLTPLSWKERLHIVIFYCLANGGHLLFLLLSRLYLALLGWKRPTCLHWESLRRNESSLFIIDTFALLPGIADKQRFQEGYLPGLWEAAQESGRTPVRLYRLYGSRHPKTLWAAMRVLAQNGDGITEAHLLTWQDWLALCRHVVAYPFALAGLIRSLQGHSPDTPEAYIRDALLRTAGQNILTGEARRLAGLRLGLLLAEAPLTQPAPGEVGEMRQTPDAGTGIGQPAGPLLVSWYENQTVDKALQRGLSQAEAHTLRHVPSIGAQLFIWPDTLLNNHPDDGEATLGLTPERILVNGPYFLPEGSVQNYSVGPSMRYGHLFVPLPAARTGEDATRPLPFPQAEGAAPRQQQPLLALLSYHPDETRRVLDLLLPLAKKGYPVQYKFHPATRPGDYAASLPENPVLITGALVHALARAGAVIGAGSGSLAEAAALGVPVLDVQDPSDISGLDLQYLPPLGKGRLWEAVRVQEDIEAALERLLAFKNTPEHAALALAFRDQLFTEPTPEAVREAFGL